MDWLLKTRFGDGYRVLSCGTSCWTNGILGDQDDVEAEAQDVPIENMMTAGAEAIAAMLFNGYRAGKSGVCAPMRKRRLTVQLRKTRGRTFLHQGWPSAYHLPCGGFFWRDKEKTLIQHYNHRSHETEPLLVLSLLMQEFPNHPDQSLGVSLTAPFEMAAASIYSVGEPEADKELFAKQQLQYDKLVLYDFRA